MIWRCPHCPVTFDDDAFAFQQHLKGCSPKKVETDAQRDAREIADTREEPLFTSYERSLLNTGNTKGAMAASQRRHEIAAKARKKAG